ncbi:MAG: hypothetical protein RR806_06195 [Oscillospiraceae bacterium]
MKIYNIQGKFLYEILDDYKESCEINKDEIFNNFIDLIYSSENEIEIYDKLITFEIPKHLVDTDIGQLLNPFCEVKYKCFNSKTSSTDFVSLIRQKINNIYVNYCEKNICTRKEYINLLYTPKTIFCDFINETSNYNASEVLNTIKSSLDKAIKVKDFYSKQKMDITWCEFKMFVIPCLHKAFENFIPLDKFSDCSVFTETTDGWCEDNFPIRYLCRYLGFEIKNYQKSYYGLYRKCNRSNLVYKRCQDCGAMFLANKKATKSKRCPTCQKTIYREYDRLKKRKARQKVACPL